MPVDEATTSPDPWTALLDWLETVLAPAWGELIDLMPYFVILGIVGPILTIIGAMWVWYFLKRRRGHVGRTEAQASPASLDEAGAPLFPPSTPYCEEHALLYPPRVKECQADGADLQVACPVDGTVRSATIQVCPACGTRYVLGATSRPTVVTGAGGPPEGGAAAA
jgi:hypothetical protein